MPWYQFEKGLRIFSSNSSFNFQNTSYKQKSGFPMGSLFLPLQLIQPWMIQKQNVLHLYLFNYPSFFDMLMILQFHMYNLFIPFLPRCLSLTRVISYRFLFLVFLQNNFLYSFHFFCKFSYSDQFYSFTFIIHLYRFYHNVYPSHVQFFYAPRPPPQYFYRNIWFVTVSFFFENLVIQTNFIVSHSQFSYIISLQQCSSVTRANF